jgi:hypothetical protein
MTLPLTVRRLDADQALERIDELADLLVDCVEGGASVNFMLPFAREKALDFWRRIAADVARGERTLLIAEDGEGRVAGTVQLVTDMPDNQTHRADVAKLLVHRRARRTGRCRARKGAQRAGAGYRQSGRRTPVRQPRLAAGRIGAGFLLPAGGRLVRDDLFLQAGLTPRTMHAWQEDQGV